MINRNLQNFIFKIRNRDENPSNLRAKILKDDYLIYNYNKILNKLLDLINFAPNAGSWIELGSAGGISNLSNSQLITSDIRESTGVSFLLDACNMGIKPDLVAGFIAKDVLHHLPDYKKHFSEINRVLKPGAKISYLEPNWNFVSKIIYTIFHPEPFIPQINWSDNSFANNPMYSNQALPYLIFIKDGKNFKKAFPNLEVMIEDCPMNGLAFILSGGAFKRNFISSKLLIKLASLEERFTFWMRLVGVSRLITITKRIEEKK